MPEEPGLDDRHRDLNGRIRKKNDNTRIDTLRKPMVTTSPLSCAAMHT